MTDTIDYSLGNGGYTLTTAQQGQLASDLATAEDSDLTQVGQGSQIYSDLLSFIAPSGTPLSGVDPAVYNWIAGAQGVNSGTGSYATLIRDYTKEIYSLRYGISLGDSTLNTASNNIAITLAKEILNNGGAIPDIEGIGTADAGSIASGLFDITTDPSGGVYAPWAGTIFFPFLGEADFYQDWLLNMDTVDGSVPDPNSTTGGVVSETFKSIAGTYDIVAALEAFDEVVVADYSDSLSVYYSMLGVSTPADLATDTVNFFLDSYGLTSGQVPGIGQGTPFDSAISFAAAPNYIAGTTGNDSAVRMLAGVDVVNAGPGDDTIVAALATALVDGGSGSNTIDYSQISPSSAGQLTFTLEDPDVDDFSYRFEETSNGGIQTGSQYLYEIQKIIGDSAGGVLNLPTFDQSFWTALGQNIAINLGSDTSANIINLEGNASGDGYFISQGTSGDLIISGVSSSDGTPATYGIDVTNPGTITATGNTSITIEGNAKLTSNLLSFDGNSIAGNIDPSGYDQYKRSYSLSGTTLTITGATGSDSLSINNFVNGDFGVDLSYNFSPISISGATDVAAQGISNDGATVGFYETGSSNIDFTDSGGTISTFSASGDDVATFRPSGINDSGVIVGTGIIPVGEDGAKFRGFVDNSGTLTAIVDPDATDNSFDLLSGTQVRAINDSGAIVGDYYDSSGNRNGYIDNGGTFTTIDDPNATQGTIVTGINDSGVIVGNYFTSSGEQGFEYNSGTFTTIAYPGATGDTFVSGINNSGLIAGGYIDSFGNEHGFVDDNGSFDTADVPGGVNTLTTGISGDGTLVADSGTGSFIGSLQSQNTSTQSTSGDDGSPNVPDNTNSGTYGNGNSVTGGNNDNMSIFGDSNTVTAGTGDAIALHGNSNTVTASDNAIVSIDGSSSGSSVYLSGNNSSVTDAGSGSYLELDGNSDVASSSGDSATVAVFGGDASTYATGAGTDVFDEGTGGSNTTISGDSDAANIYTDSNSAIANGSNETIQLSGDSDEGILNGANGLATIYGGSDVVDVQASGGTAFDLGTGGSTIALSQDSGSGILYGTGSTINVTGGNNQYIEFDGSSEAANIFAGTGDTIDYESTASGDSVFDESGSDNAISIYGSDETVEISGASSDSIAFADDGTSTLKLDTAASFAGTVAGLASGDSIDLGNFLFSGSPTISSVTGTGASGTATTITITDGTTSTALALLNQFTNQFAVSASAYTLSADSGGGSAGTLFQLASGH